MAKHEEDIETPPDLETPPDIEAPPEEATAAQQEVPVPPEPVAVVVEAEPPPVAPAVVAPVDQPTPPWGWRTIVRWLLVALAVVGIGWVLRTSAAALTPFIIGLVLAYLMLPAVNRFDRSMPRW